MKKRLLSCVLGLLLMAAILPQPADALSTAEAVQLLKQHYVDDLPPEVYRSATMEELLSALGDPYAQYFTPEEYDAFLAMLNEDSSLVGFGITVTFLEDGLMIDYLLPGGGAEEAGLQPGDLILSIDGHSCRNMTDATPLQGEVGSTATLSILRDGETLTVEVTRKEVILHNVLVTEENGVGNIICTAFGEDTAQAIRSEIAAVDDAVHLWQLDLRTNSGGLATAATNLVSTFSGEGNYLLYTKGDLKLWEKGYGEAVTDKPLIVLVNGSSASASELVAGNIRDLQRGISIGSPTYGKGVAQTIFDEDTTPSLFAGDAFKFTVFRFYTADSVTTDTIGVIPTLVVPDHYTDAVADLLSGKKPEDSLGYLKLTLNGNDFYVDLSSDSDAMGVLFSALPPDVALYQGVGGSGYQKTTLSDLVDTPYDGITSDRWFLDVATSPYKTAINILGTYGILSGDGSGLYRPEDTITRAEVCSLLAKALTVSTGTLPDFADVAEDAWYAGAVGDMERMGFVKGVGNGLFAPDATMKTGDFITLMERLGSFLDLTFKTELKAPLSDSTPITREVAAELLCTVCKDTGILSY